MPRKKIELEIECNFCDGTGIYKGSSEPKGVGVVCLYCEGEGRMMFSFRSFKKRRHRRGIQWVKRSGGSFMLFGSGPRGRRISYNSFLKGKMPP